MRNIDNLMGGWLRSGILLFIAVLVVVMTGCGESESEEKDRQLKAEPIILWLEKHYQEFPPSSGNWLLLSVGLDGNDIVLDIAVPSASEVGQLLLMPVESRYKLLKAASCPNLHEEIWTKLIGTPFRLISRIQNLSGNVFADITCGS